MQLDDDYNKFSYRKRIDKELKQYNQYHLDEVFKLYLNYFNSINAVSICFSQGGDFVGGLNSDIWKAKIKRKGMNAFFFKTAKPIQFIGRINEDVNTYVNLGRQGKVFFTLRNVMINQIATQKNKGGMTDTYLKFGTYLKTFYSVMINPGCVKVATLGHGKNERIHHKINWDSVCPKILNEKYKKR